ncbi:MAG TPA: histidine phosphatase family protein [Candidatus Binatia bacterium]|nr:histidine phosphatase family protein [Candidatus Binatia bacterium]
MTADAPGRLILVRHGESEGNRERVFTRHPDVPLTGLGRRQARTAAAFIAGRFAPVRLVSSPFLRARETAAELGDALGLAVEVEPDLHERGYGTLAGRPYDEARAAGEYDPATFWLWRPPGGETLVDVARRAGAALDRIAAASPAADVVVVSHGGVMMALWQHVTGEWTRAALVPNAGLIVVAHAGGAWAGAEIVESA